VGVTVVIPWRGGCSHREAALRWVVSQYGTVKPEWRVVIGQCATDEWCKALAVQAGVDQTDDDLLVVADADVWCDQVATAVELLEEYRWVVPHRSIRRLTAEATAAVLAGATFDQVRTQLVEPIARVHPGGGIVVLRRDVWDEVPLDRRFTGWGHEDDSWGMALRTLADVPGLPGGHLWHLWHPPQHRITRGFGSREGLALFHRYDRAFGRPDEMRSLIAEVADDCRSH
jgi:hypothetical protein